VARFSSGLPAIFDRTRLPNLPNARAAGPNGDQ